MLSCSSHRGETETVIHQNVKARTVTFMTSTKQD